MSKRSPASTYLIPVFESLHGSLPLLEHIIISQTAENAPSTEDPQLRLKMTTFTKMLRPAERSRTYPTLSKDDTAVILYTSGTTGKPKGAMLTHQNLFSNANDVAGYLGMNEKDKIVAALPMFHVFCLTVCMNAPLMSGACLNRAAIQPGFCV